MAKEQNISVEIKSEHGSSEYEWLNMDGNKNLHKLARFNRLFLTK